MHVADDTVSPVQVRINISPSAMSLTELSES